MIKNKRSIFSWNTYHGSFAYETYAEKRASERARSRGGRAGHRLFTQAASWCMARCWTLSVPFIWPPLSQRQEITSPLINDSPLLSKGPSATWSKRGVGMNLGPFMAWRRTTSLNTTGADTYTGYDVLFGTYFARIKRISLLSNVKKSRALDTNYFYNLYLRYL